VTTKPSRYELFLLVSLVLLLVWSGIRPVDRFTWILEVFPILLGVPVLIWIHPRLRFTPLVYSLIWIHACILMLGGHYTYAKVPLGFWMEGWFGFTRNHYDRIGHFAQGFIPAMLAREVFIRRSPVRRSKWLPFVVICFCLAFSAFYELIEFWTALASGSAATDFLGTQGDPWDTQWDMQLALIGSIVALVTLSRVQDRQISSRSYAAQPEKGLEVSSPR
jgi:putative membrane protein